MLAVCRGYGLPGFPSDHPAVAGQIDSQDVKVQAVMFTQVGDIGVAFANSLHARSHELGAVGFAVKQGHGLDACVIFYRNRKLVFIAGGGGRGIDYSWRLLVIQQLGLMFVVGVGRCGNAERGEQGSEHDCRERCPSVH